jgi:hypothetical protein
VAEVVECLPSKLEALSSKLQYCQKFLYFCQATPLGVSQPLPSFLCSQKYATASALFLVECTKPALSPCPSGPHVASTLLARSFFCNASAGFWQAMRMSVWAFLDP